MNKKEIYLDETASDKERVEDLLSRMTIEEKTSQLTYQAPALKHLGIPFYNWWNEALHGVARAGAATVFPQAIALSAMFDDEFLEQIGDAISTEGRAKYNEQSASGDRGIYKGLTFWSPNINIFRDPRWGRGHETYGEDPYLTGRMGVSYINGIQGVHGKRYKAAACVKHFAAHSGPEKGRHAFDSAVTAKDLEETYFPAFRTCVKEGNAEGVMGAYNRLNGEVCCGSPHLIKDILRDEWGFDGYYVSDCGAISDFHMHHRVTSNALESAALALRSGCDLNCGSMYLHVQNAYEKGMVSEEDINQAVGHLMMTRMRLGMFDEHTEYDNIPYEANDTKEHHEMAETAAMKSMVLLKNDGILPLNKKIIKTAAVIGPNSDSQEILKGNYNGTATESYTLIEGIREALDPCTRLYYSEGCHLYQEGVEGLDRTCEAVSMAKRSDVVFLCLGLNATLEGEEGDANNSYAGADKPDLNLPLPQIKLLEAVTATGTPVILLLSTGSAMTIGYAEEHCNAVMQVWYPGQMGGRAAAKLLFGAESPSGRLPVTFYQTTEELPSFDDYSMKGRTYRFVEQEALYPFGYGLSYGDFSYANLEIAPFDWDKTEVSVSVMVTNHSDWDCDEIVEFYLKINGSKDAIKNHSLVQFQRVHLKKGESKTITRSIQTEAFLVTGSDGKKYADGTVAVLYAGGSQPDKRSIELTGKEPLSVTISLSI